MKRPLYNNTRTRKYQTMNACTRVYSSRKIDYYDYESETTLREDDPFLCYCMEYYQCDSLKLRCGEIEKRAWRDKYGNIVVRYVNLNK